MIQVEFDINPTKRSDLFSNQACWRLSYSLINFNEFDNSFRKLINCALNLILFTWRDILWLWFCCIFCVFFLRSFSLRKIFCFNIVVHHVYWFWICWTRSFVKIEFILHRFELNDRKYSWWSLKYTLSFVLNASDLFLSSNIIFERALTKSIALKTFVRIISRSDSSYESALFRNVNCDLVFRLYSTWFERYSVNVIVFMKTCCNADNTSCHFRLIDVKRKRKTIFTVWLVRSNYLSVFEW
jgi:hypothetical protein